MLAIFKTDQGKVRVQNEDSGGIFFKNEHCCLAIVADGMGGHNAGELASQLAVKVIAEKWKVTNDEFTPEIAEDWLRQSIYEANEMIYKQSKTNEEYEGMGTTVVAAICTTTFVSVANIGDSRCYLMNKSGFKQMTEDHSLINELLKLGEITEEAAKEHPRKNLLLKALGTEKKCEVDTKTIICDEGDQLLLCSDGLSNKLTDEHIREILIEEKQIEEKVTKLINKANEFGGEDNISVAIVEYQAHLESGCESC